MCEGAARRWDAEEQAGRVRESEDSCGCESWRNAVQSDERRSKRQRHYAKRCKARMPSNRRGVARSSSSEYAYGGARLKIVGFGDRYGRSVKSRRESGMRILTAGRVSRRTEAKRREGRKFEDGDGVQTMDGDGDDDDDEERLAEEVCLSGTAGKTGRQAGRQAERQPKRRTVIQ